MRVIETAMERMARCKQPKKRKQTVPVLFKQTTQLRVCR